MQAVRGDYLQNLNSDVSLRYADQQDMLINCKFDLR